MMKNQFAVIGIGRFGYSLATSLYNLGYDVIAIDVREDIIRNISDKVTYAVQADATNMDTLEELGLRNVEVAIVSIGTDVNKSILAALNALELGIKKVYAKALNEQQAKVLYKIGVHKVFLPERDMGRKVAHNIVSNNILDLIELDPNHSVMEINALEEWGGKSLAELDLRAKHGINVIAVKRGDHLNISPKPTDKIWKDDILVCIGDNKTLYSLQS
ncbi:trk system potassium uptake protein TrkA [Alkalibaculum bacchi]|uniref:Trk system potassium uptake protein TrkA n=1 Tax=Alkalibaculum bacchi TaxID=645887 RepID=A0A366I9K1_9FIRM|nr:TrkA family potassium uptake protein [Alkalibaculum bacchi]RBP65395.1 trk system potassium uptake protein TrkA [Alkalibaculum bacchi]